MIGIFPFKSRIISKSSPPTFNNLQSGQFLSEDTVRRSQTHASHTRTSVMIRSQHGIVMNRTAPRQRMNASHATS
jgi:hypothetical protein